TPPHRAHPALNWPPRPPASPQHHHQDGSTGYRKGSQGYRRCRIHPWKSRFPTHSQKVRMPSWPGWTKQWLRTTHFWPSEGFHHPLLLSIAAPQDPCWIAWRTSDLVTLYHWHHQQG